MKARTLVTIAALACICWAMTSCTTTTNADGSVTKSTDPAAAAIALTAAQIALDQYNHRYPVTGDK